jgi:hypothetical protein
VTDARLHESFDRREGTLRGRCSAVGGGGGGDFIGGVLYRPNAFRRSRFAASETDVVTAIYANVTADGLRSLRFRISDRKLRH